MPNLNTLNGSMAYMTTALAANIAAGTPLVSNIATGTASANSLYKGNNTWVSMPFSYTASPNAGFVTYSGQGSLNVTLPYSLLYYSSPGTAQDVSEFPYQGPGMYCFDQNQKIYYTAATSASTQIAIGSNTVGPAMGGITNITQVTSTNPPSVAMVFVANPTAVTSTTSQSMTWGRAYIVNSASLVTLTLPTVAPLGSMLYIVGINTGGWTIAQNAGQSIRVSSSSVSTTGTGGSVSSNNSYDSLALICTVANTSWTALNNPLSSGLVVV